VNPQTFTLRTMPERVARVGDVWADLLGRGQSLKRASQQLERLRK
jgi:DNA primase